MNKKIIEREDIEKLLPHRPPFLFVDAVERFEVDKKICAVLTLDGAEPHFQGHFPGRPIMPGVLITEALAQTSGLLLALSAIEKGQEAGGRIFFLAKADMKWSAPVTPGETLFLESRFEAGLGALCKFRVKAFTKRKDVASGSLSLARVEGVSSQASGQ